MSPQSPLEDLLEQLRSYLFLGQRGTPPAASRDNLVGALAVFDYAAEQGQWQAEAKANLAKVGMLPPEVNENVAREIALRERIAELGKESTDRKNRIVELEQQLSEAEAKSTVVPPGMVATSIKRLRAYRNLTVAVDRLLRWAPEEGEHFAQLRGAYRDLLETSNGSGQAGDRGGP